MSGAIDTGRIDYGPAVLDGDLRYVSVSQVTQFDPLQYGGCNRRWYFVKVMGYSDGSEVALDTGKNVHAQVEHYQKTGEDTLGLIARQAKHLIPKPNKRFLIEHPFGDLETVQAFERWRRNQDALDLRLMRGKLIAIDVPFVGYIDLVNPTGMWLDNEGELRIDPPGTIELNDWKTSSNIEAYAKKAHDLPNTVQMVGYAEWARINYPDAKHFRLSHVYMQTRGKGAEKRTILINADTVQERWKTIVHTVGKMKLAARAKDPLDVEPNYDSCTAYRGCPHRARCPRSPEQAFSDAFGGSAMSLLARLKAKTENKTEGGHSTPAGHVAPETKPDVAAEIARLKAEEKGAPVLPPDAPKSTPATSAVPIPAEQKAALSPELRAAAEAHEGASAEKPTDKTEKKRTSKSAKEGVALAETLGVAASGIQLNLYVDCSVEGPVVSNLETYIETLHQSMRETFNVGDIRAAPDDSPLAFGKWKGMLAALVRASPPGKIGIFAVRNVRESEIKQVVVEALRPMCTVFVRGWGS